MFGMFGRYAFVTIVVLFLCGCGASSALDGGFDPAEILMLDNDYESSISINKGEMFALDMLIPFAKGYRIIGASFDPIMFRLEHYLEYEDDGATRARYMFLALEDGASDVLIKMQPLSGGDVNIYKQVSIKIGRNNSFFK